MSDSTPANRRLNAMTRRMFLGAAAASGAAFATSRAGSWLSPTAEAAALSPDGNAPWLEATIPRLQSLMDSGALTSRQLTRAYLDRIKDLNPVLHAVIETNPEAEALAGRLDAERRERRGLRGPLHGIPVLLKDNIATDDTMQTTAARWRSCTAAWRLTR